MFTDSQIETSRKLIKACWGILREEKKFIIFPVISFLSIGAVIITFLWPLLIKGPVSNPELNKLGFRECVYLFFYYMIANTIIIFFNTALIAGINKKMKGEETGFTVGLKEAFLHFRSILVFAFISSFLAMLLNYISRKTGLIGKIFSITVDLTWSLITFLTIPVMIIEGKDIFQFHKEKQRINESKMGRMAYRKFSCSSGIADCVLNSPNYPIPHYSNISLYKAYCAGSYFWYTGFYFIGNI